MARLPEPLLHPSNFDALIVVSFGGPEKREDVIPFLENVLRGKPVPRERMLEVAEHYYEFDGVSPINAQEQGAGHRITYQVTGRRSSSASLLGESKLEPIIGRYAAANA